METMKGGEFKSSTAAAKPPTPNEWTDRGGKGFSDPRVPVKMEAAMGRECQWAPDEEQPYGDNLSGHDPDVEVYMVPDFQGESGQPANQSTNRPKGST